MLPGYDGDWRAAADRTVDEQLLGSFKCQHMTYFSLPWP
jgi:hypothetical protein